MKKILLILLLMSSLQAKTIKERTKECDSGYGLACLMVAGTYEIGSYFDELVKKYIKKDSKKAFLFYDKACKVNSSLGCAKIGEMYHYARGVEKDITKATTFYTKACRKSEGSACTGLGLIHLEQNHQTKALKYFKQGCELENGEGCYHYALAFEKGLGLPQNDKKALHYYYESCNKYSSNGCNKMGLIYQKGLLGSKIYNTKSMHYFKRSCRSKNAEGCLNLGLSYYHKKGKKKDIDKAVGSFKKGCNFGLKRSCDRYESAFEESLIFNAKTLKACQAGDIAQCYYIGMIYKDIHESPKKAIAYLSTSCHGGAGSACLHLGDIYVEEDGVKLDFQEAVKYYDIACENNVSNACIKLGVIYNSKLGDKIDFKKAISYYQKACHMKNYNGCNAIGVLYFYGKSGLKQNYKKALEYYSKACNRKPRGEGFGVCLKSSVSMLKQIIKQKEKQ